MSKKPVVVGSVLVWFIPCLAGENTAMYSFALKNEVSLRRIVCDWINQDGLVLSRLTLDSPHSLSKLNGLSCLDLLQIVTLRYAKVLIDIRETTEVFFEGCFYNLTERSCIIKETGCLAWGVMREVAAPLLEALAWEVGVEHSAEEAIVIITKSFA